MRSIETKISPLIASQFPAFYQEEGPDFIRFVEAYYEWLEQNHQLLTLESTDGFEAGDMVTQDEVRGVIVAKDGNDILVHVNTLDTFKCFTVCASLELIVSSSGASSQILKGGTTRRLGTVYIARNMFQIQDIDTTVDLFINSFKEKYLKNIEFDIQSNKRLLIKNSLDLYRSKGTERSIDLFFRLIYGVSAQVYYPGDDLFKLSSAQWVNPKYLEINESSSSRAVSLVGKQITGTVSGATAFVEKYIKRKIDGGDVHVLYVTNIRGEFENGDVLISNQAYSDSPKVLGSLRSVEIVTGSKLFSVGDIVSFNSARGDYGLARVAAISDKTGAVDFVFLDGGYGYTDSANPLYSVSDLEKRTQSIVSESVVTLSNIRPTKQLSEVSIVSGGSGYSNTDTIIIPSSLKDGKALPVTDGSGSIVSVVLYEPGTGLTDDITFEIANSSGLPSTGIGANLSFEVIDQREYFNLFDRFEQTRFEVQYNASPNNALLTVGSEVRIGNSSSNVAFGTILSNDVSGSANGTLLISTSNNGSFEASNTIYLASNAAVYANAFAVTDKTKVSTVMGIPDTANVTFASSLGTFERNDEIYQLDSGIEVGNAIVVAIYPNTLEVTNLNGIFKQGLPINVRDKATTATLSDVTLSIGIYEANGLYSNTFNTEVFSYGSGTYANVVAVSAGIGAGFKIGSIADTESIYINTDLLNGKNTSNVAYMDLELDAAAFGFPKMPTGNISDIMFEMLSFESMTIGQISSISNINPGTDYNANPYVLVYQPYVAGFGKKDYVLSVSNTAGSFLPGERLVQSELALTKYDFEVTDETGFVIGEQVYQGVLGSESAVGTIESIVESANTLRVSNTTGSFTLGSLKSYLDPGLTSNVITIDTVSSVITAKGTVKKANSSAIYLKRTQFDDYFQVGLRVTGSTSGASGYITKIEQDEDSLPIGLNAGIDANTVTANGSITELEVIDSGIGYANGEIMLYTSEDGLRSGEAKAIVDGVGTGSGYYKTTKGFLSSVSKLHDGDYYQEYSYEVISKIPIDRYGEMFKKVMHTAGTRFFGSILLEQDLPVNMESSNTEIVYSEVGNVYAFDSYSDVANTFIDLDNSDGGLESNTRVTYYTSSGSIPLVNLANNGVYYIRDANATTVSLVTNPRTINAYFGEFVSDNIITIPNHNFANGDVVLYTEGSENIGLTNGTKYVVSGTNGSNLSLLDVLGGNIVAISSSSNSDHFIEITTINIENPEEVLMELDFVSNTYLIVSNTTHYIRTGD